MTATRTRVSKHEKLERKPGEDCDFRYLRDEKDPTIRRKEVCLKAMCTLAEVPHQKAEYLKCQGCTTKQPFGDTTATFCDKHWESVKTEYPGQKKTSPNTTVRPQPIQDAHEKPAPFTEAEINGVFSVNTPWENDYLLVDMPTAKTWRTANLHSDKIDTLIGLSRESGGIRALSEGVWTLAFYTAGYKIREDGSRVGCIYIPTIKAQVEVPVEELDGTGSKTWNSRPLLHCTLTDKSYVDGLNGDGNSLHTPEPQPSLLECMKRVQHLGEDEKDSHCAEPFLTSPNRKTSLLTQDYDVSFQAWKQHKDLITNNEDNPVSRLGSPGKAVATHTLEQGLFGQSWSNHITVGTGESTVLSALCEICQRSVVGNGWNACTCGTKAYKGPYPQRRVESAGKPPAQTFDDFMVTFTQQAAAAGGSSGGTWAKDRSESGHSRGGRAGRDGRNREEHGPEKSHPGDPASTDGGDGGGDSGSDDSSNDSDGDDEPLDAEGQRTQAQFQQLFAMVAASPQFRKIRHGYEKEMARREEVTQEGNRRLAEMVLYRQEEVARVAEARREEHLEQLQRQSQLFADEAGERKKSTDQFPTGTSKTVEALREPGRGDHANQHMGDCRGRVFATIGGGEQNLGKLFKAVLRAPHELATRDAFTYDTDAAWAYNMVALRIYRRSAACGE